MTEEVPFTSAHRGLTAMERRQLQMSLQWVYRGKVPDEGRGHFQGNCGGSAWYILQGEGVVRHDGREFRAKKGHWLFANMGPHYRDFTRNTEIISVRYYLEWPDGQPLFFHQTGLVIPGMRHPRLLRTAKAMERIVYICGRRIFTNIGFMNERLTFPAYIDVTGALLQWAKALYDALPSEGIKPSLERFEDSRVVRALLVLDVWPLHQAFSMDQLAKKTAISRVQLDRLFIAKLNMTPHQYFEKRRLRHADRNVLHPALSIKEVALDVGFSHVSSFSAWFKQNMGMNPNERRDTMPRPTSTV